MTSPTTTPPPAKTIRLLHASLTTGVLLFGLVAHFFMRPKMGQDAPFPPTIASGLLVAALCACAMALVLRRRVARRSRGESADLFWTTATAPAMITWAVLEGASFLALITYAFTR